MMGGQDVNFYVLLVEIYVETSNIRARTHNGVEKYVSLPYKPI